MNAWMKRRGARSIGAQGGFSVGALYAASIPSPWTRRSSPRAQVGCSGWEKLERARLRNPGDFFDPQPFGAAGIRWLATCVRTQTPTHTCRSGIGIRRPGSCWEWGTCFQNRCQQIGEKNCTERSAVELNYRKYKVKDILGHRMLRATRMLPRDVNFRSLSVHTPAGWSVAPTAEAQKRAVNPSSSLSRSERCVIRRGSRHPHLVDNCSPVDFSIGLSGSL